MLKKIKMDTEAPPIPSSSTSPANGNTKGKRAVTMEEVPDEDEDMDAGDFAPGGDADYFAEEDDEGRFFGGGLTSEQKEILNIFDSAGGAGAQDDVRFFVRFAWAI
jgi:beta-catenin-like protein 1